MVKIRVCDFRTMIGIALTDDHIEGPKLRRKRTLLDRFKTDDGTPARCEDAGRPARGSVGQRASGNERGRSACGLAQTSCALRSAKRGTERIIKPSRSSAH